MSGISKAQMDQYIADTRADGNRLISQVGRIANKLQTDVASLGSAYAKDANNQEKQAIERINRANEILQSQASERSATFAQDIQRAIDDLAFGTEVLNLGSRADTLTQLNAFKTEVQDIEKAALERVGVALDRADADTASLNQDFQSQTGALGDRFAEAGKTFREDSDALTRENQADIQRFQADSGALGDQARTDAQTFRSDSLAAGDRFRKDLEDFQSGSKSLGDLFLDRASQAQQQYLSTMGQATSTDSSRVLQFTQMADQLSQAAVQTRANMLATADPRGVELSQMADENAAAMLQGRIGADVQASLSRSSAMRALQGGFGASSEMGRGLTARDLGLTSLDLQRQGAALNDSQRTLNYNTRVAGLQSDAGALMRDNNALLSEQGRTLLGSQMQTAEIDRNQRQAGLDSFLKGAESDRNQRQGVYDSVLRASDAELARRQGALTTSLGAQQTNSARRQGVFDTGLRAAESDRNQRFGALERGFLTQADNVGSRRDAAVGLARDIYGTRTNVAGTALNENLSNLGDIYSNRYQTVGNIFNTRTALGEQMFKTGIGLSSDMYSSAVNASSDFYGTNVNVAGNIFGTTSAASTNAANLRAQAERDRLDAMTRARGAAAGTMAAAAQQDLLNNQQNTASNNAMWGSLANTGASLAGSIFGNMNFSGGGFGKNRTGTPSFGGTYNTNTYSASSRPVAVPAGMR
jgi:hypothetical protein